ncbi:MAG: SGNH/GDSL hydrolase family protein [Vicinamibacterales bacterium]|jgi:lysophospholipase L1-like esterase|nr:SGNH/GDSL hydrolase family protein [Vicinamibacterales bacterium]MDP7693533.1 SGNH/GDSL hydrolase family protein [Vicinamibacterales bacterium]
MSRCASMALSDAVELGVPALGDLAIDLYLPGDSQADPAGATIHSAGLTTNYLSSTGNHTGAAELPVERTFQSWFYLARVEVSAPAGTPVIVTLGDSITDGTASTPDTNSRWPDFLALRLVARRGNTPPGVLNVGIAGNRVLSDNAGLGILRRDANAPAPPPPNRNARFGPSAVSRLDRDVLDQPGVTHVIVFESTNDIGMAFESESPTVEEIIAGHQELIERAHARGLKIYGGTLAPFEGAFYFRPIGETKRQTFNEWIRTSGAYDAVIDFDAAVRDPDQPSKMIEAYQSGDWLHPSDEGYRVMAQAIDLALFDR